MLPLRQLRARPGVGRTQPAHAFRRPHAYRPADRPRAGHPHGCGTAWPSADRRPLLPPDACPRRPPRPLAPALASPAYGVVGAPPLERDASPATLHRLAEALARDRAPHSRFDLAAQAQLNLTLHPVTPGTPFAVGPCHVRAIPANHDPSVAPRRSVIQAAGHGIFSGTDTATLPEAVWQLFHAQRLRVDVVVLDHTYGPDHPGNDHLGAREVAAYAARLRAEGLLAVGGRVLATHRSHAATPPHPELAAFAATHGYEIAYDGLTV